MDGLDVVQDDRVQDYGPFHADRNHKISEDRQQEQHSYSDRGQFLLHVRPRERKVRCHVLVIHDAPR